MPSRPFLRRIAYVRRNRCSVLLAALCLIIVLNPLLNTSALGGMLMTLCLLAVLPLALWALRSRRLTLWAALPLALLTVAAMLSGQAGFYPLRTLAFAGMAALISVVTARLLLYVLDWHPVSTDKVFGAVAAYVLLAFSFGSVFTLLQFVQPLSFHAATFGGSDGTLRFTELLYFSFTVLTSTGLGKILPATNLARSLIVIEQVSGVMYVAFLIARLANLYGRRDRWRLTFQIVQTGLDGSDTDEIRVLGDSSRIQRHPPRGTGIPRAPQSVSSE